jgi:hypothetical protein
VHLEQIVPGGQGVGSVAEVTSGSGGPRDNAGRNAREGFRGERHGLCGVAQREPRYL